MGQGAARPRPLLRNVGEIDYLRRRFGHRLFLFALECPASERWERLKPVYEGRQESQESFNADDKRDRDEEVPYGQQVQLCVDMEARLWRATLLLMSRLAGLLGSQIAAIHCAAAIPPPIR